MATIHKNEVDEASYKVVRFQDDQGGVAAVTVRWRREWPEPIVNVRSADGDHSPRSVEGFLKALVCATALAGRWRNEPPWDKPLYPEKE